MDAPVEPGPGPKAASTLLTDEAGPKLGSTFLTDGCGLDHASEPRRKKAPSRRPKDKPPPGPPLASWPPPKQEGTLHSLYNILQSALQEEVEPPPTQKACDVLKSMTQVASRWKVQQAQPLQLLPKQQQQQHKQLRQQLQLHLPPSPVPSAAPGAAPQAPPLQPTLPGAVGGSGAVKVKAKAKAVMDSAEVMHHSPPPIPLANRAVHPIFLRELLRQGIPLVNIGPHTAPHTEPGTGGATSVCSHSGQTSEAGGWPGPDSHLPSHRSARHHEQRWMPQGCSTAELIARCIKPATALAHTSMVQAVVSGAVDLPWCPEGRFHGPDFEPGLQGRHIHGPATFFVSFSYAYKFDELVAAILHHYAGLPEVSLGAHAPVYYWISAFAVNSNHGPDIRKNPETNFEVVLQRCRALLLACKPWSAPSALSRTWCLYECLVAINAGVGLVALNLELDIPLDTIFDGGGIVHASDTFYAALSELDVRRAHSSRLDHTYLLSMIDRHMGGAEQCNMVLSLALRPCLMSALLTLVLKRPRKDYSLALQLVEAGEAALQWGPAFVGGPLEGGDPAAEFFGVALRSPDVYLTELVLDPCIQPMHPSGSQGLLLTRPANLLLGQEPAAGSGLAATRGRRVTGAGTNGGFGGGVAAAAAAAAAAAGRASAPPSRASTALRSSSRVDGSRTPANLASMPTTPAGHASNAGSSVHPQERSWTANTGRRNNLNIYMNQQLQDPDWTLGGWSSSSDPDPAPGPCHAGSGSGSRGPASPAAGAAGAGPGASKEERNAQLPKSRTQLRQEEAVQRSLDPPRLMTPVGSTALASALTINPGGHLVTLGLNNNALGTRGVLPLLQALHYNYAIRTLMLRSNGIDAACGEALGQALGRNAMLTCLDLGDNPLGPAPMTHVANGLTTSGLKDLRLDLTGMESEGLIALAKGLAACLSLLRLDLSRNSIGSDGACALAGSLRSGSLQCLLMGGNQICSAGVMAVAGALREVGGRSLKMLVLRDNELGLESGAGLAELLAVNPPLACLDISDNPLMGSIGVACLSRGLKENHGLSELRLERVGMDADGAAALAKALGEGARALHRLDISNNRITSLGAEALGVHALGSETCRLNELYVERCGLTSPGRLALVSSMQANKACMLRHLHLAGNVDPDANPKAGARIESSRGSGGYGGIVVAGLSKAEQVLAQALNIGRQLASTRNVRIYD